MTLLWTGGGWSIEEEEVAPPLLFVRQEGDQNIRKEYLVETNHYQMSVLFIKYFFSLLWKKIHH